MAVSEMIGSLVIKHRLMLCVIRPLLVFITLPLITPAGGQHITVDYSTVITVLSEGIWTNCVCSYEKNTKHIFSLRKSALWKHFNRLWGHYPYY